MTVLLKLRPAIRKPTEGTVNTWRLPRGERLRREIVRVFDAQRKSIVRFIRTGRKDEVTGYILDRVGLRRNYDISDLSPRQKDQQPPPPYHWPNWHDFGLGALEISGRMTPLLTLTWESAAAKFAPRVGLDPDRWDVVNPHTERMIAGAALAFCDSMNETTSLALDEALQKTRDELHEGIVEQGEALPALEKRVNRIFGGAERWRARRIAWTETSRAVHAAQEQAAIASGVVTGWRWLASGDACPICIAIAARAPAVPIGHAFAVIGENAHYSQIKFPPAHPHCNCSMTEVLDTDEQPAWSDTLHQPEPATEDEHEDVARGLMDSYEEILAPKPAARKPIRAARPKPLPKPRPKPVSTPPPAAEVVPVPTEIRTAADLIAYGRSKGHDVVETDVAEMVKRFKMQKTFTTKAILAFYHPTTGKIHVNTDADVWTVAEPGQYFAAMGRNFVRNDLAGIMDHEIGHLKHHQKLGDKFHDPDLYDKSWHGTRTEAQREELRKTVDATSAYAASSRIEFVAEVYSGLVVERKFPTWVMGLYRALGGPTP